MDKKAKLPTLNQINRVKKLIEEDDKEQRKVQRNSSYEPLNSDEYADKRMGNPLSCSKLTSAGRILLGSSRSRKK